MTARALRASLHGFGVPPTAVEVVVEQLTTGQRLRRGATALGLGVAAAAIALPIPIVHFVLVPGALLIGLALGLRRLGQRQIFESARGRLPFLCHPTAVGSGGTVLPATSPSPLPGVRPRARSGAGDVTLPPFAPRLAF